MRPHVPIFGALVLALVTMQAHRSRAQTTLPVSVAPTSQIPKQAQWEITFAQVEAAIALPDLSAAGPETYEARVMQRPWSSIGPLPFLRLVRTDRALRAEMFLFGAPGLVGVGRQPISADVTCRDGVCVRPIYWTEPRGWAELFDALQDACSKVPDSICLDCDEVWIKTKTDNGYREQACNAPKPETPAGMVLRLMKAITASR